MSHRRQRLDFGELLRAAWLALPPSACVPLYKVATLCFRSCGRYPYA